MIVAQLNFRHNKQRCHRQSLAAQDQEVLHYQTNLEAISPSLALPTTSPASPASSANKFAQRSCSAAFTARKPQDMMIPQNNWLQSSVTFQALPSPTASNTNPNDYECLKVAFRRPSAYLGTFDLWREFLNRTKATQWKSCKSAGLLIKHCRSDPIGNHIPHPT